MTQYTVDAEAVAGAAAATRASGLAIATEVAAMMRHLATLEASWQGGAATQFGALAAQWRTTQAQVESSLDSIGVALDQAAAHYSDTEAATTRLFAV
ncbi:MAG TPA: WXG100 family type VII secretion target [Micrococcales bacterium]|uniref:ESAT-6-like protein n=1 Tax=Miniimonas arenae TaxID=676201 RepID=A0A5C5BAR2_9MICO|nr:MULTISPECIES: WXG100 family type VII secretion target [Miniimonas]TNU73604.1 WXG100 family type VII secretion target [Miniimonas arenae]HCX84286.1 WXG100 family type VII secretion target [Micrococcales bacterium]